MFNKIYNKYYISIVIIEGSILNSGSFMGSPERWVISIKGLFIILIN
tara:strand:+ start:678 stop:818 length:141 start_codon:yes stop_codon:yes gene_type:complete